MLQDIRILILQSSAPTQHYTLSLHDALPICSSHTPVAVDRGAARTTPCGHRAAASRAACARWPQDRKSTRLNSSHVAISYAVFCLKKKLLPSVFHCDGSAHTPVVTGLHLAAI